MTPAVCGVCGRFVAGSGDHQWAEVCWSDTGGTGRTDCFQRGYARRGALIKRLADALVEVPWSCEPPLALLTDDQEALLAEARAEEGK